MKGFAFDLEGTSVDLEDLHFEAYEHALADLGISMSAAEVAAIPGAIGGGMAVIFAALSKSYPTLTRTVLREHKTKYFSAMLEKADLKPRVGLIDFVERLLASGAPISIGSTTACSYGEALIQRSGLAQYFKPESCFFREDVTSLKPAPEIYLRTATYMHIKPQEQIVFEDSVPGIMAGKAAGSVVIAVPSPFALNEERIGMLRSAGARNLYPEWTLVPREFAD